MSKGLIDRINQLTQQIDRAQQIEEHQKLVKLVKDVGNVGPDDSPAKLAQKAIAAIRAFPADRPTVSVEDACEAVKRGDMSLAEELLTSQALILNALFVQSVQVASRVTHPSTTDPTFPDRCMKVALKAQEQSRKTLQTLADLKHPKRQTVFIKNQQNLLQLQQQQQNALEASDDAPLDIRSEGEATASHPEVATVEAVHRPKNPRRKGQKRAKQS